MKRRYRYDRRFPGGGILVSEWEVLCAKYDNRCLWCGEIKPLTVDHVVPVIAGGQHSIDNMQPLCLRCNSRKQGVVFDFRDNPFPGKEWQAPRQPFRPRGLRGQSSSEPQNWAKRHNVIAVPSQWESELIFILTPQERLAALVEAAEQKARRIAERATWQVQVGHKARRLANGEQDG